MTRKASSSDTRNTSISSLVGLAENLLLINDWLSARLTPARYLASGAWLRPGDVMAALPAVLLFLPLMSMFDLFYTRQEGLAITVVFAWVTVASFRLVTFGREQIAHIAALLDQTIDPRDVRTVSAGIQEAFAPIHQLKAGGIFTVILAILVQIPPQVFFANDWIKASVTLATAYSAWFVGMALFVVVRFHRATKILSGARYITHGLLPYQTPQFKQISEFSPLISLAGAIAAIVPTLIFLFFGIKNHGQLPIFYSFLAWGITATTWLMVTIPFLAVQELLTDIIKNAKAEKIILLQKLIGRVLEQYEKGDLSVIDQLEKLQKITTELHQSPNSVYGSRAVSQYLTSVILTLLPIIASAILR